MKRVLAIALLLLVVMAGQAWAAGTQACTGTDVDKPDRRVYVVTCTCTGDSSDGTRPTAALPIDVTGRWLVLAELDPGNSPTAPNAATAKLFYTTDLTANTTNARDLLGGLLTTTSATATTGGKPILNTTTLQQGEVLMRGAATSSISGNSTGSATIVVKYTFWKVK